MHASLKTLLFFVPMTVSLYGAAATAQEVIVVESGYAMPDGPRFRGGIAVSGGGEFASGYQYGLLGVDGRVGVQFNHLFAIYAQPHVGFAGGNDLTSSGYATSFAVTGLFDFTFASRVFIAGGAGYGFIQDAQGPVGHLRFGVYPFERHSTFYPRRHGLMLGLDARTYFTNAGDVGELTLGLGYEAF